MGKDVIYPPTDHEIEREKGRKIFTLQSENSIPDGVSPRVLDVLNDVKAHVALMATYNLVTDFAEFETFCDSDIERLFLLGLLEKRGMAYGVCIPRTDLYEDDPYGYVTSEDGLLRYLKDKVGRFSDAPIAAMMQVPILQYRVDFLLYGIYYDDRPEGSTWRKVPVIVECDGHDFHERTKQQAKRDRKRDRDLMAHGYHVLRFTGSELWRDPHGCVNEALRFINKHQFGRI